MRCLNPALFSVKLGLQVFATAWEAEARPVKVQPRMKNPLDVWLKRQHALCADPRCSRAKEPDACVVIRETTELRPRVEETRACKPVPQPRPAQAKAEGQPATRLSTL